ncbi:MAG: hypothetical protein OXN17_12775 [Candidatus Poribacteria bacterium]|nr:hypothetical protein [Candidatus Poribacteria bacterium]MDE0506796.1 hypothetical protein [Candidatus Poribacteria bacterium]
MRAKEVLYAVIGGVVGTVLTMSVGARAPLGAKDEPVDLNARMITCRGLEVVDEKGKLQAGLNFSEYGGSVFVVGKLGKGAEMHLTKLGGAVFVWGKEAKGGAGMHLDSFGGRMYVEGRGFKEAAMTIDQNGGKVSVEGKEGNQLKTAAMSIDGHGGAVDVRGKGAGARIGVNKSGNGGFSAWDEDGNALK